MKIANTTVEKQLSIFKKFSKGDDLTDKGRDLKVERKNKEVVYFRVKYPPIKQRGQITIFNIKPETFNQLWTVEEQVIDISKLYRLKKKKKLKLEYYE